jgi:hypothetical protein
MQKVKYTIFISFIIAKKYLYSLQNMESQPDLRNDQLIK